MTPRPTSNPYLRVLRARLPLIVGVVVAVTAAAVLFSHRQQKLYRSSSEVLLHEQNLGTSLTGAPNSASTEDPVRYSATQAQAAAVLPVAQLVLRRADITDRSASRLLAETSVSPSATTDVLVFAVTDPDPALAERLASQWARSFVAYSSQQDAARYLEARSDVDRKLRQLDRQRRTNSTLYEQLANSAAQLQTLATLQTGTATVIQAANGAVKVQPLSTRNVVLGVLLGLLLGIGLAFAFDRMDTRLRSPSDIDEVLGVPQLGRISRPPGGRRPATDLVMLTEGGSMYAEEIRQLRPSVQFASVVRDSKVLMIASAVQAEGKSTTAANLAVSCVQAGRRVALVDLDLRRPTLHLLFHQSNAVGVSDVVLGNTSLEDALVQVPVGSTLSAQFEANGHGHTHRYTDGNGNGNGNGRLHAEHQQQLDVLFAGPLPPNPGDFVQSDHVARVIESLAADYDLVLIDTAPLLAFGDALAASAYADAVVLVSRLGIARRPMMRDLTRVLATMSAPVLGYILTGAERGPGGGYHTRYGYQYGRAHSEPRSGKSRVPA